MQPLVGIIMGSKSDWETIASGSGFAAAISACRTKCRIALRASHAGSDVPVCQGKQKAAAWPSSSPVPAEPPICREWSLRKRCCRSSACRCRSKALNGLDSLLSIVQMPGGIPVGTLAIGQARRQKRGPAGDDDPRQQGAQVPPGDSRVSKEANAGGGGGGGSEGPVNRLLSLARSGPR